jgi:hypothetical protein
MGGLAPATRHGQVIQVAWPTGIGCLSARVSGPTDALIEAECLWQWLNRQVTCQHVTAPAELQLRLVETPHFQETGH